MPLADYSPKVKALFLRPVKLGLLNERSVDPAKEALLIGDAGSVARGDALRLSLRIDKTTQRILDAGYQNFGSGMPLASASSFCMLAIGKDLDEAGALTAVDLDKELDGLPELQQRKAVLILDAYDNALRKYRNLPLREKSPPSEDPLCTCFQISANTIERAIRLRGLDTIKHVTAATHAGAGCQTCHPDIQQILERCKRRDYHVHITLDEYERAKFQWGRPAPSPEELAANPPVTQASRVALVAPDGFVYPKQSPAAQAASKSPAKISGNAKNWRDMSHSERLARLEEVLEINLRPAIQSDGGDIKLVGLEGEKVRVTLHGHCRSCFSALSTLKFGVEKSLRENVWPELEVEEVVEGY